MKKMMLILLTLPLLLAACAKTAQELPLLTLEDVVVLAEKGDDLILDDFDGFAFEDVGSGLYVRQYTLAEEGYSLTVGGAGPELPPMYIHLTNSAGDQIDIRYFDVQAFIDNPASLFQDEIDPGVDLIGDHEPEVDEPEELWESDTSEESSSQMVADPAPPSQDESVSSEGDISETFYTGWTTLEQEVSAYLAETYPNYQVTGLEIRSTTTDPSHLTTINVELDGPDSDNDDVCFLIAEDLFNKFGYNHSSGIYVDNVDVNGRGMGVD